MSCYRAEKSRSSSQIWKYGAHAHISIRSLLALSLTCLSVMAQQSPKIDTSIPQLLPESTDVVGETVRAARAELFDIPGWPSLLDVPKVPPGAPPPPPPAGTVVRLIPLPELPIDNSDVVVVGEVSNVQPFLTSSRSSLYTEYTIRVLDTVKSAAKVPVTDSLVVFRQGGVARLESGRVIEWPVSGRGDPLMLRQQYLFFLTYRGEAEAYLVDKFWHVKDGSIKAAYPDEKARASQFRSENDGRLLTEVVSLLKARLP
jgi:hypothetical protein